jgi:hypothetical protein
VDRSSLSVRIARVILVVVGILLICIAPLVIVIIVSLVVPGTALDGMWAGKPDGRAFFDSLGLAGILFLAVLGIIGVTTGVGLLQRRRWARWVTVVLLGANAVPDLVQGFLGKPENLFAAVPVALLVVYLALPVVGRALRRPNVEKTEN